MLSSPAHMARHPALRAAAALAVVLAAACTDDATAQLPSGTGGSGAGGTPSGTGNAAATGGSGGGSGGGNTGGAGAGSTTLGPFRHGVNFGYVPGFSDVDMATLARAAGVNGARLSFPERHFVTWGYGIEVSDNQAYQQLGVTQNVAFLNTPAREHSSAPANTPDGELQDWIPANLYEPIFVSGTEVNPNNYWADYVAQTVATYQSYVKVYSVWNEPDWVSDWQVTTTWATEPPTAAELPRFNGSIFDYVRMLRITSEVAKSIDPDAKVAVGGLGYRTFMSAILRYTDNPVDGSVDADHPYTGGRYVDVMDVHYYPIFAPGSSDEGVDRLIAHCDGFAAELLSAGEAPRPFIVTESGAPRVAVGSAPGGELYARNYLLKAMVVAQRAGIAGIDWFALSDGSDQATNSFASMGLYERLADAGTVELAVRTPSGEAYRTLGALLEDARVDLAETAALGVPAGVEAVVFRVSEAPDAKRVMVLWARAAGGSEDAVATASVATVATWNELAWDAAAHGMASTVASPTNGTLSVALDSTPRFYVEQ